MNRSGVGSAGFERALVQNVEHVLTSICVALLGRSPDLHKSIEHVLQLFHCRLPAPHSSCGVAMSSKRKVKIEHDEVVGRFARRLRELRVERGMTQADLARRAGVTATYVSKLESGGAAPGIDLVEKLAGALGVNLIELFPAIGRTDSVTAAREQAQDLFNALLKKADLQTYALLNPLLALLLESSAKRG